MCAYCCVVASQPNGAVSNVCPFKAFVASSDRALSITFPQTHHHLLQCDCFPQHIWNQHDIQANPNCTIFHVKSNMTFIFPNAEVMSLTASVPFSFINRDVFLQLYVDFPWLEALFEIIVTYFWLSCGCLLSIFLIYCKERRGGEATHICSCQFYLWFSLCFWQKNLPQWK